MDVSRFEINTWAEYEEAAKFIVSKEGDEFKTVVHDTTDWLEKIVINEILRRDGKISFSEDKKYAFGKGDLRVKEFFLNKVIPTLEAFNKKGKNVVLIAHAVIKGIDDPVTDRYDQYVMDMSKKSGAVLKQWVNNMFFLRYKIIVTEGYGIEKNTATGGTEVYIHTRRTPQYEAKRREDLPDEIKFIKGKNPYEKIIWNG